MRANGRPQGMQQDAWREHAACNPATSTVSPDERFLPNEASASRAKAACGRCPVQAACLSYATRTQQPWGVWGGQTSTERGTAY